MSIRHWGAGCLALPALRVIWWLLCGHIHHRKRPRLARDSRQPLYHHLRPTKVCRNAYQPLAGFQRHWDCCRTGSWVVCLLQGHGRQCSISEDGPMGLSCHRLLCILASCGVLFVSIFLPKPTYFEQRQLCADDLSSSPIRQSFIVRLNATFRTDLLTSWSQRKSRMLTWNFKPRKRTLELVVNLSGSNIGSFTQHLHNFATPARKLRLQATSCVLCCEWKRTGV